VRRGLRGAPQRRPLNVTGYELLGDKYPPTDEWRCRRVPASDVLGIEPEEVFEPLPERLNPNTPFHDIILAASERYGVDADLVHCVIVHRIELQPQKRFPPRMRAA